MVDRMSWLVAKVLWSVAKELGSVAKVLWPVAKVLWPVAKVSSSVDLNTVKKSKESQWNVNTEITHI